MDPTRYDTSDARLAFQPERFVNVLRRRAECVSECESECECTDGRTDFLFLSVPEESLYDIERWRIINPPSSFLMDSLIGKPNRHNDDEIGYAVETRTW